MRKAIISIFIAVMYLLTAIPGTLTVDAAKSTYESNELLSILNLLPEEAIENDSDAPITRGQFAYSAAMLSGTFNGGSAGDVEFADVAADYKYAGAIGYLKSMGVIDGHAGGNFRPDDAITISEAMKILVNIADYEKMAVEKGGYPSGYNTTAAQIGLYDGISSDVSGKIDRECLEVLLTNALDVNMPVFEGVGDGNAHYSIGRNSATVMEQLLGVFVYEGEIVKTQYKDYSANVLITDNRNYEILNGFEAGETAHLAVNTDIDMGLYKNVPAEIYVKDGKIIYLQPEKDVEVFYKTVYSVNGDSTPNTGYHTDTLSKITFLDDEEKYNVSDDLKVIYNGKPYSGNLALNGTLVRTAVVNDEVIIIEAWDFKEGGIISKIEYTGIHYQKGAESKVLRDYEKYVNKQIIIDGNGAIAEDLKIGGVFSYYADEDYENLVIAVSEICIAGDFEAITNDGIQVGQIILNSADNLYAFENLSDSTTVRGLSDLLKRSVKAYLNPFGEVAYLCTVDSAEFGNSKNFVGYLTGVRKESFDRVTLRIISLGDIIEERILTLSEKADCKDGLILNDVLASSGANDGTALYRFRLNGKDEVSVIEKMLPYDGYGEAVCTPTSFVASSIPTAVVGGKNLYFDTTTKIYMLYEKDGEQKIKLSKWSDINGLTCSGITMRFYGKPMQSEVDMILLSGNVDSILKDTSNHRYKLVTGISQILDEDGEIKAKIDIADNSYVVSEDLVSEITAPAYIRYSESIANSDEPIVILEHINLKGDFGSWEDSKGDTTIQRGTVEKFDGKRLYLSDGTILFMNPRQKTYYEYTQNGELKIGYEDEVVPGDYILYFVYKNDVPVIVYE